MIALWWLILALVVSCFDIQAWDKKRNLIFYMCGRNFHKYFIYIKRNLIKKKNT
jgi:hypothetical protein